MKIPGDESEKMKYPWMKYHAAKFSVEVSSIKGKK